MNAEVVDGEDLNFAGLALGSRFFPWANLTEMLVSVWAIVCRPSGGVRKVA